MVACQVVRLTCLAKNETGSLNMGFGEEKDSHALEIYFLSENTVC